LSILPQDTMSATQLIFVLRDVLAKLNTRLPGSVDDAILIITNVLSS
jgi:hypothetical protein